MQIRNGNRIILNMSEYVTYILSNLLDLDFNKINCNEQIAYQKKNKNNDMI